MTDLLLVTKRCTKCGGVLPLTEFYRDHTRKDGHRNQCKSCVRAYIDAYQAARKAEDPEGWRREVIRRVDRHRRTPEGHAKSLAHARRRGEALKQLVANHRAEYEQILRVLKHEEGA